MKLPTSFIPNKDLERKTWDLSKEKRARMVEVQGILGNLETTIKYSIPKKEIRLTIIREGNTYDYSDLRNTKIIIGHISRLHSIEHKETLSTGFNTKELIHLKEKPTLKKINEAFTSIYKKIFYDAKIKIIYENT